MRQIADGERPGVPATIDDPAVLGEITEALSALGYPGEGSGGA
jgi:propionyl-CoA synthetase